jgi:LysM repeat protein
MTDRRPDDRDDFVISRDHHVNEKDDALDQEIYYENTTRAFEKKSRLPFIAGAASLILIVLLFIIFWSGSEDSLSKADLRSLEARIEQLENKGVKTDEIKQNLDRLGKQETEVDLLINRFNQFESSVSTQIDQIIKELGALHQKTAKSQPPKKQSTKAVEPQKVDTAQKANKSQTHEVQAGDTLYGISRRYGLTLQQLQQYNNIGPNTAIYPGQKLKLAPN